MKIVHKITIFFKRIQWYIEGVYKAVIMHKEVENYEFLIKTLKILELRFLEMERKENEEKSIIRLEAQIDVIKKILKYVR